VCGQKAAGGLGKELRAMGRPAFAPSAEQRKQVETMAGYGITEDDIALVLGIDPKTLRKHFRVELDTGHVKANARVAESLYLQAVGAPAQYDADGRLIREEQKRVLGAAIWWEKTRCGRSEYAPPLPKPLGKKAAAELAAQDAARDTDWSELIDERRPN
jgi:hypothetical protein